MLKEKAKAAAAVAAAQSDKLQEAENALAKERDPEGGSSEQAARTVLKQANS